MVLDVNQFEGTNLSREQIRTLQLMERYSGTYYYHALSQLKFELDLRQQTIQASYLLNQSGADFATFETSKCNERYWILTRRGGFRLRPGVLPHTAINDIFYNGRLYAFECALAMVLTFYKAVLEEIGPMQFNYLFPRIYLFSWEFDQDLGLRGHLGTDYLPGDCVYFQNPDFHPNTPEWNGLNAILLNGDLYFGHGFGIGSADEIIAALNSQRSPYATRSAFLNNLITRPNFHYLSQFAR